MRRTFLTNRVIFFKQTDMNYFTNFNVGGIVRVYGKMSRKNICKNGKYAQM